MLLRLQILLFKIRALSELSLGPRIHCKEIWLDFELIHCDKPFAYPISSEVVKFRRFGLCQRTVRVQCTLPRLLARAIALARRQAESLDVASQLGARSPRGISGDYERDPDIRGILILTPASDLSTSPQL